MYSIAFGVQAFAITYYWGYQTGQAKYGFMDTKILHIQNNLVSHEVLLLDIWEDERPIRLVNCIFIRARTPKKIARVHSFCTVQDRIKASQALHADTKSIREGK